MGGSGRWWRVVLVAALVGGLAWLAVLGLRPAPIAVRTALVARGAVEATLSNTSAGTVKARVRSKLSAATAGSVVELTVQRGSRVAKDDVLLRLESATQAANVALAERAVESVQAVEARSCIVAERAARELARNEPLAKDRLVSDDVLDGLRSAHALARAECAVNAAEVARARAALDLARTELDRTVLRAPYDAIVAEVPVQLGEWVSPSVPLVSAPAVIDLIDPSSIYVGAPMDEVDSAHLAPGVRARVTLDPFPGRSFAGRVLRVAPYVLDVERQNRTVEIEVELDDAAFARTLLPGTSADAELVLEERADCLRVPTAALLAGARVLVLHDGRLVERAFELGSELAVDRGPDRPRGRRRGRDEPRARGGRRRRTRGAHGRRAVIRLAGIGRRYVSGGGELRALADVDLVIERGEHVAVMGPSGSGKSTLLNVIGCLDRPTEGSYRLEDREVSELGDEELARVRREVLAHVFQAYYLVDRLDALENVALPLLFAGTPTAERRERARAALAEVGLVARAHHRPGELSGGEKQRVAIARAIVMRPRLLLADEPTGNLDRASGRVVLDLLDRLNAGGMTLVVVTHDPDVARRARRVLLFEDGRLVREHDRASFAATAGWTPVAGGTA
ncbi:MAG: efflux RND transporter periplasmic adaptor subunit [Planctomycetes bacterium]|nr:efflux RND transporter periplasmic adaptor subunit [Planctomycetota bacterium]